VTLPGIDIDGVDGWSARVLIDGQAWLGSELAREQSLACCNRLRLAGWRLDRHVA
jgi:hypothetical protein